MRILGTEPSSAILSQTKLFKKLKWYAPKLLKQAKAKRDGVINPQNSISITFNTENFDALNCYESTEVDHRTFVLGDSLIHQQWHSPSSLNIKGDFY